MRSISQIIHEPVPDERMHKWETPVVDGLRCRYCGRSIEQIQLELDPICPALAAKLAERPA
jgi:hypothetical protein